MPADDVNFFRTLEPHGYNFPDKIVFPERDPFSRLESRLMNFCCRSFLVWFLLAAWMVGIPQPDGLFAAVWQDVAADNTPRNQNDAAEMLWQAARTGDLEQVRKSLDSGTPVDARTPYDSTALCFACDRGHLEVVRLLLERGADPNVKDKFYKANPLSWATSGEHHAIITELLKNGATGADDLLFSAVNEWQTGLARAAIDSGKVSGKTLALVKRIAESGGETDFQKLFESLALEELPVYAPTPEQMELFAGQFAGSSGNMQVTLGIEEDRLVLFPGTDYSVKLVPLVESEFWGGGARLVFALDDGKVTGLKYLVSGQETELTPVAAEPAVPASGATEKPAPAVAETSPESKNESVPPAPFTPSPADLAVSSANWPGFRGTGSRGIADGQHPPVHWNADENQNVLWQTPIPGLGFSCPTVWGDRIYVTSAVSADADTEVRIGLYGDVDSVEDDSEYDFVLCCLDKNSGDMVWQQVACSGKPAVRRHSKSSHANPTVATNGEFLIAFFGSEGLYCYDMNGTLVWKKDLGLLDSGWFLDPGYQWGFGSSPIVFQDRVIVQCDIQKGSFVASFDIRTGDEVWRTDRAEIPTWPTPVVHQFGDLPMLITHGTRAARGYDARDGQLLWSIPGHSEIVAPTPIVAHDLIFVCSGYSPVQPILAIRPTARGEIGIPDSAREDGTRLPETDPQIAWSVLRGGPYMQTPLAYGDYLYVCSNSGILTCYEAVSGTEVYKKRISGTGTMAFTASPVAADGYLYFTAEDGIVYVVRAGAEFVQESANPMGATTMATPAISENTFYGRTVKGLIAFRTTGQQE